MIASWMLYALAVSALAFLAGAALERAVIARQWPRRFVWVAMLVVSMAWPFTGGVRHLMPAQLPAVTVLPMVTVQSPIVVTPSTVDRAALVDRALAIAWALWSGVLLVQLVGGMVRLRRSRRGWRRSELDGQPIRLSDNVGPAVIGLRSMDVVVPEWIVHLDAPLRAIVLRHEDEHRSARDPYLLFGAAVALALMPWNIALWLQARRLRLAIEVDCDARVLRVHPSPERYGMLMLTIAQRRSIAPTAFAPMLSEPATQLERRIVAMQSTTRKLARLTMLGGGLIGIAVLVFACSLQSENPASPKPMAGAQRSLAGGGPIRVYDSTTFFEFQVEHPVTVAPGNRAPRYPDSLRVAGVEGQVLAQFVVDTTGFANMSTFKVRSSTHALFTETVRNALPTTRFVPATVGGHKVKQLVQMPFQFDLGEHATTEQVVVSALPLNKMVEAPKARSANSGPLQLGATVTKANGGYREFRVEKTATPVPGNRAPRYPDQLRESKVEGTVLAQFVVDTTGYPVPGTLKILQSSNELFTQAVRNSVDSLHFYPAMVGNRKVKQLMQMPFQFNLAKDR